MYLHSGDVDRILQDCKRKAKQRNDLTENRKMKKTRKNCEVDNE